MADSMKPPRKFRVDERTCWEVLYRTGGGWSVNKCRLSDAGKRWFGIRGTNREFEKGQEIAALDYAREQAMEDRKPSAPTEGTPPAGRGGE